ncbi:MAG: hypothetical protein RLY20_1693 [Verrucomicrobiota bacterium]|jgi:hypothetical protein
MVMDADIANWITKQVADTHRLRVSALLKAEEEVKQLQREHNEKLADLRNGVKFTQEAMDQWLAVNRSLRGIADAKAD